MITAGVVSLLFKLLKQPVVLGYIVAGILVGPHLFGEGIIQNEHNVEAWGNIGVLFVLFCIGLEFRIKNLIKSGKVAAASMSESARWRPPKPLLQKLLRVTPPQWPTRCSMPCATPS